MITTEPIDVADGVDEAKTYLRIETDDEDSSIAALLTSAALMCEAEIGALIINREVTERLVPVTKWTRLSASPVSVIDDVRGITPGGATIGLPVSGYAIDIDASGDGWVRLTTSGLAYAEALYRAGVSAQWRDVPSPLRLGIVRLAATMFANRDALERPVLTPSITALWHPYRQPSIGGARAKVAA